MKRTILILTAALTLAAPLAMAQGNSQGNGRPGASAGCPPGLAKKNPPCIPPGQAGNPTRDHDADDPEDVYIYDAGEQLPDRYVFIENPALYGLNPDYLYYEADNRVYRVDQETREVLAFIGALSDLLD